MVNALLCDECTLSPFFSHEVLVRMSLIAYPLTQLDKVHLKACWDMTVPIFELKGAKQFKLLIPAEVISLPCAIKFPIKANRVELVNALLCDPSTPAFTRFSTKSVRALVRLFVSKSLVY